MKKKMCSGLLIMLLLLNLSATNILAAGTYYLDSPADHSDLNYADMDVSGFTTEPIYDAIEQLSQAYELSGNEEQVKELFDKLMGLMDQAYTTLALYDIEYYNNVLNEENATRSADLENELNLIYDQVMICISAMSQTEYSSIAEAYFDCGVEDLEYEAMTEEEKALSIQENELVQKYDALIAASYEEEEEEAWYQEVAGVYLELLSVRNQLADLYGYDSYMDYAYENVYGRDYTAEEAGDFRQSVKDYVLALNDEITDELPYVDGMDELYNLEGFSEDEILEKLGTHLPEIHPELVTAYDVMKSQHLYEISDLETKMDMGYTINLNQYRLPFLYNTPYGDFYDMTCTIHEFGHFNQMYHSATGVLQEGSSYDVSEIHSQGLELLFLEYAEDIYGEGLGDAAEIYAVYCMLASVIDGCLNDEFQQRAFELENPTVEDLTDLYKEVSDDYGSEYESGHEWVSISHTFESPFYYISYATSALGALEIYALALDDREAAVDKYMQLTAVDDSMGLVEALEAVGLDNVMEASTVEAIAETLGNYYVDTYSLRNVNTNIMLIAGAVAFAIIVLVVVVLIVRGGKKPEDEWQKSL